MLRSIRWKLASTYLVMILLTIGILTVLLLYPLQNYYLSLLQEHLLSQTKIVRELVKEISVENDSLQAHISDWAEEISLRITVIDSNGKVLADSHEDPANMENHLQRPEVQAALQGKAGKVSRFSRTLGQKMVYIALPLKQDGELSVVRLAVPASDVTFVLGQVKESLLMAVLGALVVGLIISFKLASSLTQPVEEITQVAGNIANGDFDARFEPTTDDEIAVLGKTINYMAEMLKDKVVEIERHRKKMEMVLNNMVSGVMMLNAQGEVELVNKAAERELQLDNRTAVGRHNLEVIRNHRLNQEIDRVLKTGEVSSVEVSFLHPQKKIFLVHLAPTRDDEGISGVIAVFLDITRLRQVEQMRKDFVANVSHELRTPLTSISGFVETMLTAPDMDRDTRQKFLKIMAKETSRLNNIIDDLLELSRIESGKAYTEIEVVDLSRVVAEVVEEMRPLAERKSQELQLHLRKQLYVMGDKTGLEQVVVNLLDNAIKYTPEKGEITVSGYEEAGNVMLTIRDTGVGIPPESLGRIFERFYRVDKARSRKQGGPAWAWLL
ncbi:MAG: HAMP domain-containing protein [Thermoanaerobacteraceae bacterium]|nr:HAMP domain-containing protein [Thermoanaerobacteraceae bacterium]